jgi:hypothetical protein
MSNVTFTPIGGPVTDLSSNGRFVTYTTANGSQLNVLDTQTGNPQVVAGGDSGAADLSRDGRFVAYLVDTSTSDELKIRNNPHVRVGQPATRALCPGAVGGRPALRAGLKGMTE